MKTNEIRKMIKDAVSDERKSGRLAEAVRNLARQRGLNSSPQDVQGLVSFVQEYIEHVPHYMEQGAAAGGQLGLSAEMGQMLRELEAYWFQADDVIPDWLGLMGLMDDAYASLLLLQSLSDYCMATHGRPLLQQNFTQANQVIRGLIGEPAASQLDQRVGITVANAMMQRVVGQMMNSGFAFGAAPDPIWGNASIDEIVNVRLGAMGVV